MKLKKAIKYIFLAIFLIALGYFSMKVLSLYSARNRTNQEVATARNETTGGKVLGEEGNQVPTKMYASQNFKTPQITFGGDAITMPSGQQAVAPEILDMRSELLTTKTDQQVKFLLTWKTNKLCNSSIDYTKEGQAEAKTVSEEGYGFVHSVEIAPLNYSTSYSYAVTARDKWGIEIKSDKLAFYTGAQNVSVFDLLAGAFKDMFGWAGGK
jgi:hypothetical protein